MLTLRRFRLSSKARPTRPCAAGAPVWLVASPRSIYCCWNTLHRPHRWTGLGDAHARDGVVHFMLRAKPRQRHARTRSADATLIWSPRTRTARFVVVPCPNAGAHVSLLRRSRNRPPRNAAPSRFSSLRHFMTYPLSLFFFLSSSF